MKRLKRYKEFKQNNEEGTLITIDDIITCIKKGGVIYATIIKDYPKNNPKDPISPIDVDEEGLITVKIDNSEYYIDLDNVEKIEY